MEKNTKENNTNSQELNLVDIFNTIFTSIKLILIISITFAILTFVITSGTSSTYKTTALVEIGLHNFNKNVPNLANTKELIDSSENAIRELSIEYIYKDNDASSNALKITLNPVAQKLIAFEVITTSAEEGEALIETMTETIINLHRNRAQLNTIENEGNLNFDITQMEGKVEFNNQQLFSILDAKVSQYQKEVLAIEKKLEYLSLEYRQSGSAEIFMHQQSIEELKSVIPSLDEKINLQYQIIEEDRGNLLLLEANPKLLLERAAKMPTLNQIINSYQKNILEYEAEKTSIETKIKILNGTISKINNALKDDTNKSFENLNDRIFSNADFLLREKNTLESELNILNKSINEINEVTEKNVFHSISGMPYPYNELITETFNLSSGIESKKKELKLLLQQTTSHTSIVSAIKSSLIESQRVIFIIFGFIFGFILSIALVLFIDFLNTTRKSV